MNKEPDRRKRDIAREIIFEKLFFLVIVALLGIYKYFKS